MRCHMYRFDTLTAAIWTVQRPLAGGGGQGHSGRLKGELRLYRGFAETAVLELRAN